MLILRLLLDEVMNIVNTNASWMIQMTLLTTILLYTTLTHDTYSVFKHDIYTTLTHDIYSIFTHDIQIVLRLLRLK